MSDKSLFDDDLEKSQSRPPWESPRSEPPQFPIGNIIKAVALVGLIALFPCMAFLLSISGILNPNPADVTVVGAEVPELQGVLHADPRYADTDVVIEMGTEVNGVLTNWVEIILEDSQCPSQKATDCAEVINEAVRVILTAPSIDHFVGVIVTQHALMPKPHYDAVKDATVYSGGKPPLAQHTLDEWRAFLDLPTSSPKP